MIFIDTGAFLARYLSSDRYHSVAIGLWSRLGKKQNFCFTSNFVLDETFTLLGRRAGYAFAAERAENIYASELLTILRPGHREEMKAIESFRKFLDQGISFTDCISFVLMKNKGIKRVFSFDKHFQYAGFTLYS